MNRRAFLTAVTAAVGGFALDPERALWVPGQRTYFDIVRPMRRVRVLRLTSAADHVCFWAEGYRPRPLLASDFEVDVVT